MNTENTKRTSIKTKEETKQEILTGVVDNETKTYTFQKTISILGEKKTGTFKAKYLGVSARLRIGTIRAKLLEGAPQESLDVLTDDLAYMIAYLTVALTQVPSWWDYDCIDEIGELREVYLEVYEFMQSFRGKYDENTNVRYSSNASGEETVETK